MKDITIRLASATLLAAALATSPASLAQSPAGESTPRTGPGSEASPALQRHHAMAGIMRDMVQEVTRMQRYMDKGDLTPQMRKLSAANLKRMSEMMRRMSGSVDRPTMKEPEMHRQFEEMRRQVGEMSRSHFMSGPATSR